MGDIIDPTGRVATNVDVAGVGVAGVPAGGVLTVQGTETSGIIAIGQAFGFPDGTVYAIQGLAGNTPYPLSVLLSLATDGSHSYVARTPALFKSFSALVISGETTIWTPTAGKKFRLMGYVISQGVLAGAITLKDGTAGTTILIIPPNTAGVVQISPSLGNGILSAVANNLLTATGSATETITGYVFGTEE